MSKSNAILVGVVGLTTGFLFGNIFLIIAGSLILANETSSQE